MPTLKCRKTLIVVGAFTKGTLNMNVKQQDQKTHSEKATIRKEHTTYLRKHTINIIKNKRNIK